MFHFSHDGDLKDLTTQQVAEELESATETFSFCQQRQCSISTKESVRARDAHRELAGRMNAFIRSVPHGHLHMTAEQKRTHHTFATVLFAFEDELS